MDKNQNANTPPEPPDEIINDRRRRPLGISEEDIAEALRSFYGKIGLSAELLGCSQANLYLRVKKSPFLLEVIAECKEKVKDTAELQIYKLIEDGHFPAIWKFLTTQAKDRGWIENNANAVSPEMEKKYLEAMAVIKEYQDLISQLKYESKNDRKEENSS